MLQGAHPRLQELGGLRRQEAEQRERGRSDVSLLPRLPGVRRCQQLVRFQPLPQVVDQLFACQGDAALVSDSQFKHACIHVALIAT